MHGVSAWPLSPLQGGNPWTKAQDAALVTSIASAHTRGKVDWDIVAAHPGLEDRTGVRIQTCIGL